MRACGEEAGNNLNNQSMARNVQPAENKTDENADIVLRRYERIKNRTATEA